MSGASLSADEWSTRLEPQRPPEGLSRLADDPRLGEVVEFWNGAPDAVQRGRAVLVGFPQNEGVRRNGGRVGAAEAPDAIRHWLYRLTPSDHSAGIDLSEHRPLDLGNVRVTADLEKSQQDLGLVIAVLLNAGAVPVVLGGGHETAYGHFLGYVAARRTVGIINVDAHLDVRPCLDAGGHSGSAFRQALEHPTHALSHYVCLGAQPHAVSREHAGYVHERGGCIRWCAEVENGLAGHFDEACRRLANNGCQVYVTLDADAVCAAEVPGVSAPNPAGLRGLEVIACARRAGASTNVSSLDLVEINTRFDRDGQSARWAALVIWHFLVGHAGRGPSAAHPSQS
ncbi:MAG TPA: formimidoylglutamase [Gemmataceae bacterium]